MIVPNAILYDNRSDRERLRLTGPDRLKFLHNYCTNDIKKLVAGSGCEAFVTSPQGKTIGFFSALADQDSLLLHADPDGFSLVLPHFAKYGVFDEVAWNDERESTFEIHAVGENIEDFLTKLEIPLPGPRDLDHISKVWRNRPIQVVRESPFGTPGFSILGTIDDLTFLISAMEGTEGFSVREITPAEAEGLRIEAGTPVFGVDISAENLPQEIGRDVRAISFVKGCYLGQETVARLDALGHVNKILMRLQVTSGDPPKPGDALLASAAAAGVVTSSGQSPRTNRTVALAMVRLKTAPPGTVVAWNEDGRTGEGVVSPCELKKLP